MNGQGKQLIQAGLQTGQAGENVVSQVLQQMLQPPAFTPTLRSGPLASPLFLGLIPTRGCNMGCRYCDFAAPKKSSPVMDVEMARNAIDAYFNLLCRNNQSHAEVHFFGGEPFFAEKTVHFAVDYARQRAAALGLTVSFEVTTNGFYAAGRAQWIADTFDVVVLSLDGTADVQDSHRPAINGGPSSPVVLRSARIFSEGQGELLVRACVTHNSVSRLPEFASWVSRELRPSTVCFETLITAPLARSAGMLPPAPFEFARYFDQATRILAGYQIDVVLSTADLRTTRANFCPVGQDALIVSPDGAVDACYLLEQDWKDKGLDMRLGWLKGNQLDIAPAALQHARSFGVDSKALCRNCLCRFHCVGGCPVTQGKMVTYDSTCLQTRAITIVRLLRQMGEHALADAFLEDVAALEQAAWQSDDRLVHSEVNHGS